MLEAFRKEYTLGRKVAKTIPDKGLFRTMLSPEPDEIIHLSGNIRIDAIGCVGFICGWLVTAPKSLLSPEIILLNSSTSTAHIARHQKK